MSTMENNPKQIIIHHSGVSYRWRWRQFHLINRYHRQKWNFKSKKGYYIGYHYFIEENGLLYHAREDREDGAHTIGHNHEIGICLAGNFNRELPTEKQSFTLERLLDRLTSLYKIDSIGPHRKYQKGRVCYGTLLSDSWAQDLIKPARVDDEEQAKQLAIMRQQLSLAQKTLERFRSLLAKLR